MKKKPEVLKIVDAKDYPKMATYDFRAEVAAEILPAIDALHKLAAKYDIPLSVAICESCSETEYSLYTRVFDPTDRARTPRLMIAAMSMVCRPENTHLWLTAHQQILMIETMQGAGGPVH